MLDVRNDSIRIQVLDTDSHAIHHISNNLNWFATPHFLLRVVETSRDHVGLEVLGPARADHLVDTVFDNGKFACVEDHADVRVGEVELFVAGAAPWQFREFSGVHVAEDEGAVGVADHVSVLVDVDFGDLVASITFDHDTIAVVDSFDDDLGERDISEFELAFVPRLFQTNIKNINGSAERPNSDLGPICFP